MKILEYDVVVIGSGVAGSISALELDGNKKVALITKKKLKDCNSYLAQGGICTMRDDYDKDDFINDTLKAGHNKNKLEAVKVMVEESRDAINSLINYGVDFNKEENGHLAYTKEGGHNKARIAFCQDQTGKWIMESLIQRLAERENIHIYEQCTCHDIIVQDSKCIGAYCTLHLEDLAFISSKTILATGGLGGVYKNTTNFKHIQGDSIAIALKNNIKLKDISYIQIHPTAFYEDNDDRRFLISESVRGEGALLFNHNKKRFIDELQPRDIVSKAILNQMDSEKVGYEWLDMTYVEQDIKVRFPNIYNYVKNTGIDPKKDLVPIVPAQHYTMGGIDVDLYGKTSMKNLYAVGETACTGVHGKNRLASNSLLESVVYGKRVALDINKSVLEKYYLNLNKFKKEKLNYDISSKYIKETIKNDRLLHA
ncbi:L-aspartate oxidase [Peptostreptococcus equinus]|uniref:L-aspartate oxidase n=1 Tax=Peptostreptococcus equinus TaxID=3003601 RepID=A0ABY7JPW1_9FIRM|nr:L-aspartate oxidase [Peptostreptococcus sp. CBA3647]WAW15140.1 L-aspartate oxidase [Peptostreptococcus sp. CBA3647]